MVGRAHALPVHAPKTGLVGYFREKNSKKPQE